MEDFTEKYTDEEITLLYKKLTEKGFDGYDKYTQTSKRRHFLKTSYAFYHMAHGLDLEDMPLYIHNPEKVGPMGCAYAEWRLEIGK